MTENNTQADPQAVLMDVLANQRNAALNELAKAQASLVLAVAENERLTKQLAEQCAPRPETPPAD